MRKVARNINAHPNLVHRWMRMFSKKGDSASVGKGDVKPEDAEFKSLRRGLEEVKEERDIFKKTLDFFFKRR